VGVGGLGNRESSQYGPGAVDLSHRASRTESHAGESQAGFHGFADRTGDREWRWQGPCVALRPAALSRWPWTFASGVWREASGAGGPWRAAPRPFSMRGGRLFWPGREALPSEAQFPGPFQHEKALLSVAFLAAGPTVGGRGRLGERHLDGTLTVSLTNWPRTRLFVLARPSQVFGGPGSANRASIRTPRGKKTRMTLQVGPVSFESSFVVLPS